MDNSILCCKKYVHLIWIKTNLLYLRGSFSPQSAAITAHEFENVCNSPDFLDLAHTGSIFLPQGIHGS